jgi:hypothetical protein
MLRGSGCKVTHDPVGGTAPTTGLGPVDRVNSGTPVDPNTYKFEAWTQNGPLVPAEDVAFRSPSGNITCTWGHPASDRLLCDVNAKAAPAASQSTDCGPISFIENYASLTPSEVKHGLCTGGILVPLDANTLPYGSSLTYNGYGCISEESGITCVAFSTGRGFTASKGTIEPYAP